MGGHGDNCPTRNRAEAMGSRSWPYHVVEGAAGNLSA